MHGQWTHYLNHLLVCQLDDCEVFVTLHHYSGLWAWPSFGRNVGFWMRKMGMMDFSSREHKRHLPRTCGRQTPSSGHPERMLTPFSSPSNLPLFWSEPLRKAPLRHFSFLLSTTNAFNIFCSWCFLEQQSDRQTLDKFLRAAFCGCGVSGYRRCRQVGNQHTLSCLIPFVTWLKVNLHMCFGWIVFVKTI